jgi:hypothetical protein
MTAPGCGYPWVPTLRSRNGDVDDGTDIGEHIATTGDVQSRRRWPIPRELATDMASVRKTWPAPRYIAPMLRAVAGGGAPPTADFEVGYVGPDGTQARVTLADAVLVRFEQTRPVRTFPSYKRQRYFPACGGQRPPAGISGTSPGSNATT